MKAIYTLLFIAINLTAWSQNNYDEVDKYFRFGVKAGANFNKITGSSFEPGYSMNYLIGSFVQFNFSDRLGLQPEVNLVQAQSTFTSVSGDAYNELFIKGTTHYVKLDYLEIPMLINVNLNYAGTLKMQAGPSLGLLINSKVDNLKNGSERMFKPGQWSAVGGLWAQLHFINFGVRYRMGLSNINAYDDIENWKNKAFQVFAGVTL